MSDLSSVCTSDRVAGRAISTAQLLGRDPSPGTARIVSFAGFGMLIVS